MTTWKHTDAHVRIILLQAQSSLSRGKESKFFDGNLLLYPLSSCVHTSTEGEDKSDL